MATAAASISVSMSPDSALSDSGRANSSVATGPSTLRSMVSYWAAGCGDAFMARRYRPTGIDGAKTASSHGTVAP